jgi:hypothetical protein
MSRKKRVFDLSNWIFWIILLIIIIIGSPLLRKGIYKDEPLISWLNGFDTVNVVINDPLFIKIKDPKNIQITNWKWTGFDNKEHAITFNYPIEYVERAKSYRTNYGNNFTESQLYYDFVNISNPVLDSMTSAMKVDMNNNMITQPQQILDYVVSAIQFPKYTKITDIDECPCNDMNRDWKNDCNARLDGSGCCNSVIPFAVFTPAEFILKKTGDCDTKALIAYAILKKLGFDVAVIVGDADGGAHAMLAVANVSPVVFSNYVTFDSKMYFPWEVTSRSNSSVLGYTGMWNNWSNWKVSIN